MGEQALDVIVRLSAMQPALGEHPMMRRLRARALLLTGRAEEARAAFRATTTTFDAKAA
jgi:hypothetical protein